MCSIFRCRCGQYMTVLQKKKCENKLVEITFVQKCLLSVFFSCALTNSKFLFLRIFFSRADKSSNFRSPKASKLGGGIEMSSNKDTAGAAFKLVVSLSLIIMFFQVRSICYITSSLTCEHSIIFFPNVSFKHETNYAITHI